MGTRWGPAQHLCRARAPMRRMVRVTQGLEECACECYAAIRERIDKTFLVDRMRPIGLNWRVPKLDLFLMIICSLFGTGQRAHPFLPR